MEMLPPPQVRHHTHEHLLQDRLSSSVMEDTSTESAVEGTMAGCVLAAPGTVAACSAGDIGSGSSANSAVSAIVAAPAHPRLGLRGVAKSDTTPDSEPELLWKTIRY